MKSGFVKKLVGAAVVVVGLVAQSEGGVAQEPNARVHTPKGAARAAYAGQTPFTDSMGGVWSLMNGNGDLLTTPVTKTIGKENAVGVKIAATAQPHITENETDTGLLTGTGAELNDDELALHPYDDSSAVLCYTVTKTGIYDIFVGSRSLQDDSKHKSVAIQVFIDEENISLGFYTRTVPYLVYPDFEKKEVYLQAGQTVKVYVSPLDDVNCDWTAIRMRITELPYESGSWHDAWQAVHDEIAANGASRRPSFVDAEGCGWSFGWAYVTYNGERAVSRTMTEMDILADKTQKPEEPALGWQAASPAKNPAYRYNVLQNLPRFLCYEGTEKSTTFFGISTGGYIRPRELFTHPNSVIASMLRFTAPKDGIYQVLATLRDMANSETHVKGWLYVDAGPLCVPQVTSGLATDRGLFASYVYLQKDATVDFAIAPNSARVTDADSTAIRLFVTEMNCQKMEALSVDITSGKPHTGRGRVGYGTAWDLLAAANGMTSAVATELSAWRADGARERKTAKFQLSRSSGFAVATGDGFRNNGVVSASADDEYEFSFSGLGSNSKVRLYLYGQGSATFVVDDTPHKIDLSWFDETSPDYVVVETTANRKGVVEGVFRADGSTSATFSGVQVLSDGLRKPSFGVFIR